MLLRFFIQCFLCLALCGLSPVQFSFATETPATQPVIESITGGTNAFRKEQGRSALKVDQKLAVAAQHFAQFMAETGKYGHEADGRKPADRAKQVGYEICLISENIAYRFSSRGFNEDELAESFVAGWIKSPPHRKNMLAAGVVEIGVGVARSPKGVYYGVQLFGRPESMKITFTVVNRSNGSVSLLIDDQPIKLPRGATMTHSVCEPARLKLSDSATEETVDGEATFIVTDGANAPKLERREK